MKYSKITTEKISENKWIAKTKVDSPLDCEVSVKGVSEDDAREKLVRLLTEE